ncbi:glycoside hydrolase family 13 protein [Flagelloscypha sp. PMI_526]|nr:glycoside hydrolase family 13 protein [Flagelloscypha sp. PMI_526]
MASNPPNWWKAATVYQVYIASFLSTQGKSHGDLNGILSKLDYIKDLGADVIWLNPVYKSPQKDMGYDISDYRDIDPQYGTLEDWDALLQGVHKRGMKLMMDVVFNHCSDQHAWFKESKSSKANPKRDWFIWRPPRYDQEGKRQPPNNWKSIFQGSAWEYDEATDEYYLHLFLKEQPDLNWENVEVRDAVWDIMKFWCNRGCDGFRMDVINLISKVADLPDAPITLPNEPYQPASQFFANGPKVHQYLKEMHEKVLSHYDLITVGEAPFTHDPKVLAQYVLPANKELQMVFQFELMDVDCVGLEALHWKKFSIQDVAKVVEKWQGHGRDAGYWNAVYTENHDQAKSVSRFGNDSDEWRSKSAKMLALFQITQSGTQYVYQGQELGVRNAPISWGFEEYQDIASINYYQRVLEERRKEQGKHDVDMNDVLEAFQRKARDHARLPMPWSNEAHGGFTAPDAKPWMRAHDDYPTWNADTLAKDSTSVLSFWKKALAFRKGSDTLIYGSFVVEPTQSDRVLAYRRQLAEEKLLVVLNFSHEPADVPLEESWGRGKVVFGNFGRESGPLQGDLRLSGWEGLILSV